MKETGGEKMAERFNGLLDSLSSVEEKEYKNSNDDYDFGELLKEFDDRSSAKDHEHQTVRYADGTTEPYFIER